MLSLLLAFSTASLCSFLYVSAWEREFGPPQTLDGKQVTVRGVIQDTPVFQYHRYYYLLRVEHVTQDSALLSLPEFTLRFSSERPLPCEPYDTLLCTVQCSCFSDVGLYSTRSSRLADGVALGGYLVDSEPVRTVRGTGLSLGEFAVRVRERIAEQFRAHLPEREAGLVQAMLLGRKEDLPESDVWNFRKIGASHLLVISGLHMAAVAFVLCAPFRLLVRNARLRGVLSAAAVLGFLCVTGFPPSAQRSGLMCLVALWGAEIGRPPDSYNSLGLAVLVICLQNPFSGGDLGFVLSACSTLGILLGADRLTRRLLAPVKKRPLLREALSPVAAALSVTLSAMLFTLPIQAAVFGGVSLLSPLANLILIVPCTLLLYLSIPAALLGLIPLFEPFSRPLFRLVRLLSGTALSLAKDLTGLPGGYLDLSRPAGVVVLCLFVCMVLIAVSKEPQRMSAAFLTVCIALCACDQIEPQKSVSVAVAEDSQCVVLLQGDRAAVLALGGYRTGAARELLSRNNVREVDLLCFAAVQREEREAAQAIMDAYPVSRVVLPEGQRAPKELRSAGETLFLGDGETVSLLDGVTLRAEQEFGVLTVSFSGVRIVIETGQGKTKSGNCDLLITEKEAGEVNSPFTILLNSDIISMETTAGRSQVLLPKGNGLYAVFSEDGVCKFGGDSAWLGMNPT